MEEEKKESLTVQAENRTPMLQNFADKWKIAQQFSKSDLIPENYKQHRRGYAPPLFFNNTANTTGRRG